jgi:probable O-glycosylation ligase (exosortase A-associated)
VKQTLFMIALTAFGVLGAMFSAPFVGVAVYYLFAVLRPQYIWLWALPYGIPWSAFVAWATIGATAWFLLTSPAPPRTAGYRRLSGAHKAFLAFGLWICVTYVTSTNQDIAWPWLVEYLKIFVMFTIASLVIANVQQVWQIYLACTGALVYIAYELNFMYLVNGKISIYHIGYGGLDNNGAGLMIAMGIPLALYAWQGSTKVWRWVFLAAIPLLLHAVLMSYSRGAMVALIVATPLFVLRSPKKGPMVAILLVMLALVPVLAGQEIRNEFFSVEEYNTDSSANSRFESWAAAFRMANDYPVFGVGIRNSGLFSLQYGADYAGRTIHSQYLQTLADGGYPALGLYLLALGSVYLAMKRTRRFLKGRTDLDARRAVSMMNGLECSLLIFCVGGAFLSLEVFELPYVIVLLGAQTSLLVRFRTGDAPESALAPAQPTVRLPIAHQRA